jgi:AcrR family transcriptional regulator
MYHFFPSKKKLLVAVAEEYETLLWPMIMEPAFKASNDPIQRVLAIFEVYRRFVEESDFELGCPVGRLAMEVGESVPEAQAAIARTFQAWKRHVEECLAQGLPDSTPEERAELASFVLTLVEGALVHARAERSLEPFTAAAGRLRRYLELLATKRGAST